MCPQGQERHRGLHLCFFVTFLSLVTFQLRRGGGAALPSPLATPMKYFINYCSLLLVVVQLRIKACDYVYDAISACRPRLFTGQKFAGTGYCKFHIQNKKNTRKKSP